MLGGMAENLYETRKLVDEYLLFHYGRPDEILPYAYGPHGALDFPARCVTENVEPARLSPDARALDVGCAVGRSTFELARFCREVIGIDYSSAFIRAAQELAEKGVCDYEHVLEGKIMLRSVAQVNPDIPRDRVSFEVGDAQTLREGLGSFDAVLAGNLICRLPDPMKFLRRLPELVRSGGQLIITTPFTWLEAYTPPENWLGGTDEKGESFHGLKAALEEDFELLTVRDMPFLIREHVRKFQWSVAQASVWRRR